MRFVIMTTIAAFIGTAAFGQPAAPIVYPSHGQPTEKQSKDEGECRVWAQQQTGYTGQGPAQMASAAPRGQMVGGAARGAALGSIGGAIGGDAGKGAAMGAAMGAASGLLRRGRERRHQAATNQQAQAAYEASLEKYYRAFGACMNGRGYTVK